MTMDISKFRARLGLSLTEFANACEMTKQAISNYEHGREPAKIIARGIRSIDWKAVKVKAYAARKKRLAKKK